MSKVKSFLKRSVAAVVFCAISLLVGILSALLTKGNMDIYEQIKTPPLSPPGTLFPIVWTVLFVLMGMIKEKDIEWEVLWKEKFQNKKYLHIK